MLIVLITTKMELLFFDFLVGFDLEMGLRLSLNLLSGLDSTNGTIAIALARTLLSGSPS